MIYEIQLINAILDHNDMPLCLEKNLQNVFEENIDIWNYLNEYYNKYKVLPTKTIVKDHFKSFEMFSAKEAPLDYYIDEAFNQSLSKNVRQNLAKSVDILKDQGPIAAMNFLNSSSNKLLKQVGTLKDTNLSEDYLERVKNFEERYNSENSMMGLSSGISVIDEIFGGWQPGDFVVLMGWTGSRKTWLALLFACNAWLAGKRPLIISLEMNRFQMGYRLDTILSPPDVFTNNDLTLGKGLDPLEYEEWAMKTFDNTPPFYLVTSDGIDTANQYMVQAKIEQYRPDIVILDYHGLFEDGSTSGGNETEKAKNLSKAWKRLAVKYDVPIIDIAAVTMKEGHEERPPTLDEVAWSKQLAFDADLVLAIHSEKGGNASQVVARKTRRCEPFAFYLDWDLNSGEWRERFQDEVTFGDEDEV